ncbi:MAG: hypothetical protein ACM31C_15060 [Acidobacteriota bacterium]
MKAILVAVVLLGCSKSDDCSKLVDKMMPVMKEMAGKDAADIDKGKDKFLEKCRKDDKMKNDPTMKCVLGAKDNDAVKACLTGGLDDYKKKSRANEAAIQLNALGKHAKVVFGETGSFPKGTSSVLPANPSKTPGCCGNPPDNKCPPSKDWETDPVWKALDFRIDEPTMYRYKYESADGKTFTATATGDTDCDGQEATFTLTGSVDASGNPTADLKLPEKGHF